LAGSLSVTPPGRIFPLGYAGSLADSTPDLGPENAGVAGAACLRDGLEHFLEASTSRTEHTLGWRVRNLFKAGQYGDVPLGRENEDPPQFGAAAT
jgi:hypothetical protein